MDRVAESIGADRPVGTALFVLFVPSVDRAEKPIDQDFWVDEALTVFAKLFRGATAYPRGRGMWRDDKRGGRLITEEPVIVTSYADPEVVNEESFAMLREFLHRMGRETKQGEVGIVIDGDYYGITEYDRE